MVLQRGAHHDGELLGRDVGVDAHSLGEHGLRGELGVGGVEDGPQREVVLAEERAVRGQRQPRRRGFWGGRVRGVLRTLPQPAVLVVECAVVVLHAALEAEVEYVVVWAAARGEERSTQW